MALLSECLVDLFSLSVLRPPSRVLGARDESGLCPAQVGSQGSAVGYQPQDPALGYQPQDPQGCSGDVQGQ